MELFKYLGLLSIVWLWSCLFYLVRRWPGDKTMTFSAHAARSKSGIIFYLTTFSAHLLTFYIFVANWFDPKYDLPSFFMVLLVMALLGEFVALLVPTTGGKKTVIHNIASYIMLVLLLPLSLIITLTPDIPLAIRVTSIFAVICMLGVGAVAIRKRKTKSNQLAYQIIYGGSFHLIFLVAILSS